MTLAAQSKLKCCTITGLLALAQSVSNVLRHVCGYSRAGWGGMEAQAGSVAPDSDPEPASTGMFVPCVGVGVRESGGENERGCFGEREGRKGKDWECDGVGLAEQAFTTVAYLGIKQEGRQNHPPPFCAATSPLCSRGVAFLLLHFFLKRGQLPDSLMRAEEVVCGPLWPSEDLLRLFEGQK